MLWEDLLKLCPDAGTYPIEKLCAAFRKETGDNEYAAKVRDRFLEAECIFGVDALTQNVNLFYGAEAIEEAQSRGDNKPMQAMLIGYDQRSNGLNDSLEALVCLCEHYKGRCDYHGTDEVRQQAERLKGKNTYTNTIATLAPKKFAGRMNNKPYNYFPHWRELIEKGGIRFEDGLRKIRLETKPGMHPLTLAVAKSLGRDQVAWGNYFLAVKAADCKTIFRPTYEQARALQYVELNIPKGDYSQPFPTCVVELPDAYSWEHRIYDHSKRRDTAPVIVVVHWLDNTEPLAQVWFDTGDTIFLRLDQAEVLEDNLKADACEETLHEEVWYTNREEYRVCRLAVRVALNFLLCIMERGSVNKGAADPNEAARLAFNLKTQKWKGRRKQVKKTQEAINNLPTVFALDQSIRLFTKTTEYETDGDGKGKKKRPHRRRGHWRKQRVGIGRTGVRLTLIPPVFVNGYLDPDETFETVYRG